MGKLVETNVKQSENLTETSENSEKTPVKKHAGGRPKRTGSATLLLQEKQIYEKALDYKNKIGIDNLTISGLAGALGFMDSQDLIRASRENTPPGNGLRRALSLCEQKYEKELMGKYFTGATVALRQLGWRETQYIETENKSISVQVNLTASLNDLATVLNPVVEEQVI